MQQVLKEHVQAETPMGISQQHVDHVVVRLARSAEEIAAAQHLRYKVFYEEFSAVPSPEMQAARRDFDLYDTAADHLIVIDEGKPDLDNRIVGTYRMLRQDSALRLGGFYTSNEYDISALAGSDMSLLELGRSCVLSEYRTRPVLQLLWQGITDYMLDHNVGLMFGCASLHGTDVSSAALPLSYLYHYHLASKNFRPRALSARYVDMNLIPKDQIDPKIAFNLLPPLIKGYLRVGASIGDGAVIDLQFNTIDVCIVLPLSQVTARYRKHYSRKVNRDIPGYDAEDDSLLISGQTAL